ncbi:sugar-binding protein [Candidatus Margulisiibacteriota bacterium]
MRKRTLTVIFLILFAIIVAFVENKYGLIDYFSNILTLDLFQMKSTEKKAKEHKVYFGLFREGAPRKLYKIERFEKKYGLKPHVVMWYLDWNQPFPMKDALRLLEYGAIPHIVWEPWIWGDWEAIKLDNILDGEWDEHIDDWARQVKRFQYPIFLRIMHEFNIEAYPWCLVNNDKDPQKYIKAFRYIVDRFRAIGAYNAYWVWSPMNYSHPSRPWNDYVKAYPGDNYVDWIGLDGYNWGTIHEWSQWQTFEVLFKESVRTCAKHFPKKPIMIAEFASTIEGGNKVKWITEIPYYLKTTLKQIKLIHWFDLKKEADWRIKSPPEAVEAFQTMVQDPIFQANVDEINTLTVNYAKTNARRKIDLIESEKPKKIDANTNDWPENNFTVIKGINSISSGAIHWDGNDDLSAKTQFSWDKDFLYCVFKITDDVPINNKRQGGDIWNGDAIEIAFSIDPQADKNRTEFTETDFQIGLSTGDFQNIKPSIWIWKNNNMPRNSYIYVKPTRNGYILEAKIAWIEFGDYLPRKGDKLGFTFAIDDSDTDSRDSQMIFSGDYLFYKDPSVWGTAILK